VGGEKVEAFVYVGNPQRFGEGDDLARATPENPEP